MSPTPTELGTIDAMFAAVADHDPDRPILHDLAIHSNGRSVTRAELRTRGERTAAFLTNLGLRRGDAVATLLPTCLEWIDVLLAAARIGALVVPLNTRYRRQELTHLLRLSGARILVTASTFEEVDFAARLNEVTAREGENGTPVEHVIDITGEPATLTGKWERHDGRIMATCDHPVPERAAELDDPIIVFGTSGTTSAPKLAVHTHRTAAAHAAAVADRLALGEGAESLQVLSLSGTFGFVPFLAGLLSGDPATLLPIFKIDRVLATLRLRPVQSLVAAEGSLRELLERLDAGSSSGGMRRWTTAGLAIEDIVDGAARHRIDARNVYGSSEVWAFAGIAPHDADRDTRCMPGGLLTDPGVDVRVVDDQDRDLPPGETGHLQFRGDTLFLNYLGNPQATESARTADGWFRTGDSAWLVDDRTFRYVARKNDTLRLGGYSVSPADVESAIEQLSGVRQAQVVGVRDERSGDDLGVAFVRVGDCSLDAATVLDHCRSSLASFKVPTHVEIVTEYPTTPSANGDKVRRDVLRDRAATLLAEVVAR